LFPLDAPPLKLDLFYFFRSKKIIYMKFLQLPTLDSLNMALRDVNDMTDGSFDVAVDCTLEGYSLSLSKKDRALVTSPLMQNMPNMYSGRLNADELKECTSVWPIS